MKTPKSTKTKCKWKQNKASDAFYYDTSCGHAWEFTADGIKENGLKYCPFCGKRVSGK